MSTLITIGQVRGATSFGSRHPLEPLSAEEVREAVALLKGEGKVTPTTRFVSVALKEPDKALVHRPEAVKRPASRGVRRPLRQRRERLLRGDASRWTRASSIAGSTSPASSRR